MVVYKQTVAPHSLASCRCQNPIFWSCTTLIRIARGEYMPDPIFPTIFSQAIGPMIGPMIKKAVGQIAGKFLRNCFQKLGAPAASPPRRPRCLRGYCPDPVKAILLLWRVGQRSLEAAAQSTDI